MNKLKLAALLIAGTMSSCCVSAQSEMTFSGGESVAVETVRKETISNWVLAEGLAQGIRREYLNFEKRGRVNLIAKDEQGIQLREGSFVYGPKAGDRFGQLIASIDERVDEERLNQARAGLSSVEQRIIQAESSLARAKNNLELAEDEFKRAKQIWKKKLISRKQFDVTRTELLNAEETVKAATSELAAALSDRDSRRADLNQAKVELEKTSIYAPFDGVLRTVNIRQGDYFSGPAQVLTEKERESSSAVVIIDTSEYEVTLNISAYAGDELAEGQLVYISASLQTIKLASESGFTKGRVAKGRVFSVSPSISLDKRSITVKVHTTQGASYLKDGMYVSAWILTSQKVDVDAIPYSALVLRDNKPYVFRLKDGRAWLTPVVIGSYSDKTLEILDGVNVGDTLITTGKHKLVNGSFVKVVEGQ